MALISAETATMVVVLALLVIVKAEPPSVPEVPRRTFIKFDGNNKNRATCLQGDKVRILKYFLPVHDKLNPDQYRCQLPHGEKPDDVTDDQWEKEKKKAQYVTLYNEEDKIPIFSAYQAEPYGITLTGGQEKKDTGDRAKMAWEEAAGSNSPKSSDYSLFKEYDRGHLFPVRLASDPIQAQATMKLTNAVPQNRIFNQNQWNWAGENILMKTAVLFCQTQRMTPVVFTGAVPNYWGNLDKNNPKPEGLKIGRKRGSTTFPFDDPLESYNEGAEDNIRVPTHMWSACFCVDASTTTTTTTTISSFMGFIGINLRVGHVKWYLDFDKFDNILKRMYRISSSFFPFKVTSNSWSIGEQRFLEDMRVDSRSEAIRYKMVLPKDVESLKYWDQPEHSFAQLFIDTTNHEIEVGNKMIKKMQGNANGMAGWLANTMAFVSFGPVRTRNAPIPRNAPYSRDKRSVNTSPVHSKYALIKVIDASLTSNLSLTTCTFKETYDGGEEEHQLDLEEGVFIEDQTPTGEDEVSASVNGIPVPERASTTQHLSIVLTGRI